MIYLLAEILICVVAAGLLGLVVGWLLKQWAVGDVEAGWRTRLGDAEEQARLQDQQARERVRALQADVEVRAADMTRLEGEREAVSARLEVLNEQHSLLATSLEKSETDSQAAIGRIGEIEKERDGLAEAIEKLRKDLDSARSSTNKVTAERDGLAGTIDDLRKDLDSSTALAADLEAQRNGLQKKIEGSRTELESATARLATLETERDGLAAARSELEAQASAGVARTSELENELAALRSHADGIEGGWQQRWNEQAALLAKSEGAAAASTEVSDATQREKSQIENELRACRSQRAALESEIAHLQRALETEKSRVAAAVENVRSLGREIENAPPPPTPHRLIEDAPRKATGQGTYGTFVSGRDGQHYFRFMQTDGGTIVRSEGYTSKRACENGVESVLKNASRDGGIHPKVARNGQHYFQIVATNGQVVGVSRMFKSRSEAESAVALFDAGTDWKRVEIEPATAPRTRQSSKPQHHEGERDDLKKIHGIGPVLEQLLNEHGIYRFAEIAGWTGKDIEQFTSFLGTFEGRIVRDDWVGGAKREHAAKYGKNI